MLEFDQDLNLESPADKRLLISKLLEQAPDKDICEKSVEAYCKYFPARLYASVSKRGLIFPPTKRSRMHRIEHLLEHAFVLSFLENYENFPVFLRSLDNPDQLDDAWFEAKSASWCSQLRCTTGIDFDASWETAGKVKRADFLWFTDAGRFFVECKRDNLVAQQRPYDKLSKRLNEFATAAGLTSPKPRVRVACSFAITNQDFKNAKELIERLSKLEGRIDEEVRVGNLIGSLVPRERTEQLVPGTVSISSISVGQVPVRVGDPRIVNLQLLVDVKGLMQRRIVHQMRQARLQLPQNFAGAVFVELLNARAAVEAAERKLTTESFSQVQIIGIFDQREIVVVSSHPNLASNDIVERASPATFDSPQG